MNVQNDDQKICLIFYHKNIYLSIAEVCSALKFRYLLDTIIYMKIQSLTDKNILTLINILCQL